VQLPVPLRVTLAEEAPLLSGGDWLAMAQAPAALKFTCNPFAAPFDSAVALMSCGPGRGTELGKEPRTIVWLFV
jgi:hypothetical protein